VSLAGYIILLPDFVRLSSSLLTCSFFLEYSLARDVMMEEPDFFHHVDQFTLEVHLNKLWLNDTESLYYMALLHKLLHDAGLEVMGTSIGGCGWNHEEYESMQELVDMGYPNADSKRVRGRRSCHEYLFARVPK
jgi:hypothetical protein